MPLSLYITNNLGPLLLQLQTQTKQWRDLPLDLRRGAATPTKGLWLKLVNEALLLYKLTFDIRKRRKAKFHKIWGRWLASPLTLSPILP